MAGHFIHIIGCTISIHNNCQSDLPARYLLIGGPLAVQGVAIH
jgi:hypothetical protein